MLMNEQDDPRLDNFLRDRLDSYKPTPSEAVWAAVEARLGSPPPPPRSPWRPPLLPAIFTGLLGVLIGWLLPHPPTGSVVTRGPRPAAVVAPPSVYASAPTPALTSAAPAAERPVAAAMAPQAPARYAHRPATAAGSAVAALTPRAARQAETRASASTSTTRTPRATGAFNTGAGGNVATLAGLGGPSEINGASAGVPAVLWPLVAAEAAVLAAPAPVAGADSVHAARTRRVAALWAEKRVLVRLHHRADSLLNLLALGAEGTVTASALAVAAEDELPPVVRAVVVRRPPALTHRWAVTLNATPERAFLQTAGAESATATRELSIQRQHHENGRTGLSAALGAEYRLNERVSMGGGLGYTRLGTELRLTEHRTEIAVRYTTVTTVTDTTTSTVTTPTVQTHTTEEYRVLRPVYHFLTVPVAMRYRLTPTSRRTRCWADVALGAQVQFFRGGRALVADATDGTPALANVRAARGPFRPVSVALTGAVAVNYALSPRLVASAAPTVRWPTQSVYRREAGLRQRLTTTGVQLGLHWTL